MPGLFTMPCKHLCFAEALPVANAQSMSSLVYAGVQECFFRRGSSPDDALPAFSVLV